MLLRLLAVAALCFSGVFSAADRPETTRAVDLNPPKSVLDGRSFYNPVSQEFAREWTNAKRLASGLPLKPPTRMRGMHAPRAEPSGVVLWVA
ncbi:hypothetical protein H0H81_005333 [Sphagnurus paluster]|uniref:Uncharacterized protein n=1 Tax=Sphagnurus paluster TaxID=117069 RepID=A0A9P7GLS9_9AGAR|nr:hypothetical protein H0H81_005333 [Sphagnurus paluster]